MNWEQIDRPYRPQTAAPERIYLQQRIAEDGPGVVVSILLTYAMMAPTQGSYAGSLWALAEWAKSVIPAPARPECKETKS